MPPYVSTRPPRTSAESQAYIDGCDPHPYDDADASPSWEAIAMLVIGRALLRANCPTFARWTLRAWFELIALRGRIERARRK